MEPTKPVARSRPRSDGSRSSAHVSVMSSPLSSSLLSTVLRKYAPAGGQPPREDQAYTQAYIAARHGFEVAARSACEKVGEQVDQDLYLAFRYNAGGCPGPPKATARFQSPGQHLPGYLRSEETRVWSEERDCWEYPSAPSFRFRFHFYWRQCRRQCRCGVWSG
jgi:hypothetical protein